MVTSFEDAKKHIDSFLDKEFTIDRYDLYLKQYTKLTKDEKEMLDNFSDRNRGFYWTISGDEKRSDEYELDISRLLEELKLVLPKSGVIIKGNSCSIHSDEVLGETLSIRDVPELIDEYDVYMDGRRLG